MSWVMSKAIFRVVTLVLIVLYFPPLGHARAQQQGGDQAGQQGVILRDSRSNYMGTVRQDQATGAANVYGKRGEYQGTARPGAGGLVNVFDKQGRLVGTVKPAKQ